VTADPDRAWFSPLLNRIAEIAGARAALLLGRDRGCQTIYISLSFADSAMFADAVADGRRMRRLSVSPSPRPSRGRGQR
jgi:hypothetical protein